MPKPFELVNIKNLNILNRNMLIDFKFTPRLAKIKLDLVIKLQLIYQPMKKYFLTLFLLILPFIIFDQSIFIQL